MDAKVKVKPNVEVIKEPIHHVLIPGEMGAVLELIVKDKNGKVTEHRVMRSKSFVKQFLELLWVEMYSLTKGSPQSIRDTGNVLQDIYERFPNFKCDAAANDDTLGIIVGSGTDGAATTPTIDDYKIETLIAHGVGAAQMQYGGVTFGAPVSDATTSQFTITRDFTANADITVYELALYVQAYDTADTIRFFMTIRDAITGGILVPNGQVLTVNYREQVVI